MDERKNLELEAETARANMNEIAGELHERTKVGKRVKMAVVDKTKATGAYVKSHPVAIAVAGGLIGLAAGALLPVHRRERGLLDKMQAKLQEKLDELTGGLTGLVDDDDSDAELSPDMDMTALAGEEDALDRMETQTAAAGTETSASAYEDEDDDDEDVTDESTEMSSTTSSDPYKMPS